MPDRRRVARLILLGIPALAVMAQLVPYGRSHENPPAVADAPWDSPRTKELFFRTCGDCHSNQTVWPWYSSVAPLSWILQRDVTEGRGHLNVSEYGLHDDDAGHAVEEVRGGDMPPEIYRWMHPSARLTPGEESELLRGLGATFGTAERSADSR